MTRPESPFPTHALIPLPATAQEADLQNRILARARVLFLSGDGDDFNYRVKETGQDGVVWVGKRGEKCYRVDLNQQTCTCPIFCGVHPLDMPRSGHVHREGRRLVARDGSGNEIKRSLPALQACKHFWACLLGLHLPLLEKQAAKENEKEKVTA